MNNCPTKLTYSGLFSMIRVEHLTFILFLEAFLYVRYDAAHVRQPLNL